MGAVRAKARGRTAGDLMNAEVVTILPSISVAVAAERMLAAGVRRLPVEDDLGRLAGIVTRSDLLKVRQVEPATIEVEVLTERTVAGLRERVALADLAEFFARAIPAVAGELARQGVAPAGPPTAVYRHEFAHEFDVTVGFPVAEAPTNDALVIEKLPAGRAVQAEHVGPYSTLPAIYTRLSRWFSGQKLNPPTVMWEEYLVGPGMAEEFGYLTRVVYPLD